MACGSIDHASILDSLTSAFQFLRQFVNHDGLFIWIVAFTSIRLLLLYQRVQQAVLPPLVDYLRNKLWRNARQLFNGSRLAFQGFTIKACVVSLTFAYVFYTLLKWFFRFPGYWQYSLSAIIVSLIVFSLAGYFMCGRVRLVNFFKYFYIPATGGIGVLVANFFSDNLVNLLGAAVTLLTAA